jgi:predicted DCC family thiol-disulfide oxidoreductase YuxK
VSASKAAASDYRFSLYWLFDGLFWVHCLFALNVVVAGFMILGARTRLATLLAFILLVSLHNRNPVLLQGGDNLLLLLLFWGMFVPLGARWSIDASMTTGARPSNSYVGWGSAALILQVLSVYFFSAFLKNGAEWVSEGSAIYYALHNDQVAHLLAPYWRDWHWLTRPLTHYVWWLELIGPLVALLPVFNTWARGLAAVCFITLEVGFLFNLNVGLFPFISITSLLVLLPTGVWDYLGRVFAGRDSAPMVMYYDQDCGFCKKTCYLLRSLFKLDADIIPAQTHPEIGPLLEREFSWVLVVEDQRYLRWEALVRCIALGGRMRWCARPLALLSRWGDGIYHWIGEHRAQLGSLTALIMPWRSAVWQPGFVLQTLALLAAIVVLAGNVTRLPTATKAQLNENFVAVASEVNQASSPARQLLRLDQLWNMFAPYPQKNDGWFLMVGLTSDGQLVDVLHWQLTPPTANKPAHFIPEQAANYRWRKYLTRMKKPRHKAEMGRYASAICRRWNMQYAAVSQAMPWPELEAFNIYYMKERTPPMGQIGTTEVKLLWRHHCLDKQRLSEDAVKKAMLAHG